MKSRWFSLVFVLSLSIGVLFTFFSLLAGIREAAAAPMALTVTSVSPTVTQNDLDTPLVITGTGFVDGATAMLGDTALTDVTWVSAERLEATLPWGVDPGIYYDLTVTNPGGASATLPEALSITQGLGVWTHASGPEGGTVINLLVNPITPTILYAVPDGGGLFRSLDAGETWEFSLDQLAWGASLSLGADGHTVYAATGGRAVDVWRSDDNGQTWQPIPIPGADGMHTIYAHPAQAELVFAIVDNDGWGGDGLYRSENRGQDWVLVSEGITDTAPTALGIDPLNPLTMALGTASGKVFLSTDGSQSWSFASQAPVGTIDRLTFHPSGSGEVWVNYVNGCGVAKSSTPDLSSWIPVEDEGGTCNGYRIIYLPPLAWGEAYSQTVFSEGWTMRMSSDGGLTWNDWGGQSVNSSRALAFHPTDPNTLYVGSRRLGTQLTIDGGVTWRVLQKGLTGIVPDTLAVLPDHPETVYAQEGDSIGVYRLEQGGAEWYFLPVTPTYHYWETMPIALDAFQEGRLYLATNAIINISPDGGQNWPITATLPIPPEYAACWNGITALAPNPFSPGVLLAGVVHSCDTTLGGLYLSVDSGESWMRVMAGETISQVMDLAYDWGSPGTVYAAARGSGVLRSTNGGLTWEAVNNGLDPWDVSLIETEPVAPYRVYASEGGGLYMSEDQGESWTNLSYLPPGGGYGNQALHFAPGDPPVLYLATGAGLYASTNGGNSWGPTPDPLDSGTVWSLGSASLAGRTVLYAGGAGGVYRFSSVAVGLSGMVTDADTGLPVAGAEIRVSTSGTAFTGPNGVYSLTLPSGVYMLTASADGYYAEMVYEVEMVAKDVVQNFALAPAPPVEPWAQVSQDGFGDPNNGISVLEVFQPDGSAPYLYAGVWGNGGEAKMWRTSDGWNWEVAGSGWLSPTSYMMDAQVFDGQLYLGLSSPAQLWRTDGETWQAVDTVGFGDTNNQNLNALAVFGDQLYAAVLNYMTGVEIWRSSSGNPGTWSQVNEDGFGGWGSGDMDMKTFQGYLYAGFASPTNSQLWRTNDGTTWEPVFTDGLDYGNNGRISLAEFNGQLYLGFRNIVEGGQIWRSANGVDWEPLILGGFSEVNNGRPYGMIVADGALYVVFSNPQGAQVWRTFDGNFWQRVNLDGWGDPGNFYADYNNKAAAVFNFNLYIGTLSNPTGGEIWKLFLAKETIIPFVAK